MDFFFGLDALQNYFSEILGIALSVVLLPILIRFYFERKNRSLKYMFFDRVFSFSKHIIGKYLPDRFKEVYELQRYSDKKQTYYIFQSFRFIDLDDEEIEGAIGKKLAKLSHADLIKFIEELKADVSELENEINLWLLIYKDVSTDELSQLIHKLLYELRSFKHRYGQYLQIDGDYVISNYSDYVTSIVFELTKLYKFVLTQYPIEEKEIEIEKS